MENNYREILLNSYIALSDSTLGLKDIAYAKLLFLVFYFEDKPLKEKEIKRKASVILNSISIPDQSFNRALDLLKARGLILEENNSFVLIEAEREKVNKQLE